MIDNIINSLKEEINKYPFSKLSKQTLKKAIIELYHIKIMDSLKELNLTKYQLNELMELNLKELDTFINNLDRHESIFEFAKWTQKN